MLFLVNLSMDFLTVYLTARLTHAKTTMPRSIAAAVVGALYGVATVIHPVWYSVVATGAVAVLMTILAFGIPAGAAALLRQSFLVWGCGALLGGVVSTIMALGEPVFTDSGGSPSYAGVYVLTFGVAVFLVRILTGRRDRRSAQVEVVLNGETVVFTALCDSGNLLREPLGGSPVIVAAEEVFPMETREVIRCFRETGEGDGRYRLRVIPHKTVDGGGMLYGFVPDSVKVDDVPGEAVIALGIGVKRNGYGGLSGIVPLCLCGK